MKLLTKIFESAKATHRGILKSWATLCESYFSAITDIYPELIKSNINDFGKATIDLLEHGHTDDEQIKKPQYPPLSIDPFHDPVTRSLYEVGAIQIHQNGETIVEPNPAVLLRGLARLSLPKKFLFGIVNAVRQRRGQAFLVEDEFDALDQELFASIRRGLKNSIGEFWFTTLNKAIYHMNRSFILPCIKLPGSQEFYEEGIKFYQHQGADSEVYIYSTTSGLVIPKEFKGDNKKNHYRYKYFTKGILGKTVCKRIYQWERYRTARELALGYETEKENSQYINDAYDTFSNFARADNLAIYETQHFSPWKNTWTLMGPIKQQSSNRRKEDKLKIGHGFAYDANAFDKRTDLLFDAAKIVASLGVIGMAFEKKAFFQMYGPAFALAAVYCNLGGVGIKRLKKIHEPILKKCKKDREMSGPPIKDLGITLSRKKITTIVDKLLSDGIQILESEKKMKIANHFN